MTTNPSDDVFKHIAKAMEELLKNLPIDDSARFIGCTIITGSGDDPRIFHLEDDSDEDFNYEIIEGSDTIFISAEIPSSARTKSYAEIHTDRVVIHVDDEEYDIDLPCTVHIGQSTYTVQNGIMDIVCKKMQ